jgi:predicted transcriptional regulator
MQDGKQPRAQGVTNQTFTLDTETVARLDDIAKAWGMNKSAVIRKLVSNVVIVKPDA